MSKNESRQERKNRKDQITNTGESRTSTNKIYYWIIGILFVVLVLLVLFIFTRSGNDIKLEDTQDQTANIQEENKVETPSEDQNTATDVQETEEEDSNETEEVDETETTEDDEDSQESENLEVGESETVTNDLPHDTSHATDYSNGSADRIEIKERVMEVTGLGNDLIENWVGNDGPGRVVATVSSRDQTEHYEVYLQYGDGRWNVESYQRLSENPY